MIFGPVIYKQGYHYFWPTYMQWWGRIHIYFFFDQTTTIEFTFLHLGVYIQVWNYVNFFNTFSYYYYLCYMYILICVELLFMEMSDIFWGLVAVQIIFATRLCVVFHCFKKPIRVNQYYNSIGFLIFSFYTSKQLFCKS